MVYTISRYTDFSGSKPSSQLRSKSLPSDYTNAAFISHIFVTNIYTTTLKSLKIKIIEM